MFSETNTVLVSFSGLDVSISVKKNLTLMPVFSKKRKNNVGMVLPHVFPSWGHLSRPGSFWECKVDCSNYNKIIYTTSQVRKEGSINGQAARIPPQDARIKREELFIYLFF